jgi:hypothetical protein
MSRYDPDPDGCVINCSQIQILSSGLRVGGFGSEKNIGCYYLSFILRKLQCVPVMQDAVYTFMEEFVPHMEEEETTFQPLLSQYFQYEELKQLKVN